MPDYPTKNDNIPRLLTILKSSAVNYYEFQSLNIKHEIKAYLLFYIKYAYVF